jgi:hypothetical protein
MLERFICRVYDRIHLFACDVALHDLDGLLGWEGMFFENLVHLIILPPLKDVGATHASPL